MFLDFFRTQCYFFCDQVSALQRCCVHNTSIDYRRHKNEIIVKGGKSVVFQCQTLALHVATSDNSVALKKFAIESIGTSNMELKAHHTRNTHNVTCFFQSVHCYIARL